MTLAVSRIPINGAAPLSSSIRTAYPYAAQVILFGDITSSYSAVPPISTSVEGSASFAIVSITNTTNEDIWVCFAGKGAIPEDQWLVLAGTERKDNLLANRLILPITYVYVRSDGADPTSGKVVFGGYVS